MFNAFADRLHRIWEECPVIYTEEQEALGEVNAQDPWMEMVALGPNISNAEIQDNLDPIMNPVVNFLQRRLTPEENVNAAKFHLEMLKADLI